MKSHPTRTSVWKQIPDWLLSEDRYAGITATLSERLESSNRRF
ncbi:MAG: hypothetical protein RPU52_05345 [Candidatus Sedimenticola sp. (ex Thyasira tokunagai)]